ncbi:uncharacterized protein BCR38DRAFT_426473 [Pseudomassariella vexata]|uniref:Uncharacterized protein n=1 Tax=Pseudomassariella vexata TaxID=1141098 RepID=A0A1Y2E6N7_9PEZI|nr:uncharacterized protein BCR38DRAFT_426473 [Pseudomassariella vexata]ORY67243.1 hypothetical protein BCR38DRAFT_426473 [Pseudomassariella vexata]
MPHNDRGKYKEDEAHMIRNHGLCNIWSRLLCRNSRFNATIKPIRCCQKRDSREIHYLAAAPHTHRFRMCTVCGVRFQLVGIGS